MDSTYADGNLKAMQGEFDECTDTKTCISEAFTSKEYIKQEPCDTENEPGNVHNYLDIKDEITEDPTVVIQETGRFTDSADDKVCVYETVVSREYIQEGPCDTEKLGSICNYRDIKFENIDDQTVSDTIRCDGCGEEYDLYCLKCPMLIRIFDSNNPNTKINRVRWTLPENFVDICETSSGAGIIALRPIPKGVVFGPFGGLDPTKDGTVSKWKLKNKEVAYTKNPKGLNWMQYIKKVDRRSHRNLIPFQYEDELYYHSDYHIGVGEELLVCWDSNDEESGIRDIEDYYWEPRVYERLDDSYACTICCIGYKSICHLMAHNCRCPEKINQKDFCKDVVQCAFCKIYLDKREYSDYHMDRCCDRNVKKYVAVSSPDDYAKYNRDYFQCHLCSERFARSDYFAFHQKKKHFLSVYKCDKCVFETDYPLDFVRHLNTTHKDARSYGCNTCDKQFKLKKALFAHVKNMHNGKVMKYKCLMCDYETIQPQGIKVHLLKIHGGIQRFKCPRCAFKTCFESTLQHHVRYHEDPALKEAFAIVDKIHRCCKCDYRTYKKANFNRHVATHNIGRPYKCDNCSQTFKGKEMLVQHARNVHSNVDERRFKCPQCPFETNYKYNYKNHVNRHKKCELFRCTKCDYSSYHKSTFAQHRIRHERRKKHACRVCSFETNDGWELDEHMRTHEPVKSKNIDDIDEIRAENETFIGQEALKCFECSTCGMTFKYNGHLVRHEECSHASNVKEEKRSIESDV